MRAALAEKKRRGASTDALAFVPSPAVQLADAVQRSDAAATKAALAHPPEGGWSTRVHYAPAMRTALQRNEPTVFAELAFDHHRSVLHVFGHDSGSNSADSLCAALPDSIQLAVATRNPVLVELAVHQLVLRYRIPHNDHRVLVGTLVPHRPPPRANAGQNADVTQAVSATQTTAAATELRPASATELRPASATDLQPQTGSAIEPLAAIDFGTLFAFTAWLIRNRDRRAALPILPGIVAADAAAATRAALADQWPAAASWLIHLFAGDARFLAAMKSTAATEPDIFAACPSDARLILAND